jgi:hypothetical protein
MDFRILGSLAAESAGRPALTWLEAEHQVLLAAIGQAVSDGFDAHAWQLSWSLDTFLDRRGYWPDYAATQNAALAAATRLGNQEWQARTHQCLGWYHSQLGEHDRAMTHCQQALELRARLARPGRR